ncbi:MAG TPA: DUF2637 domain-containing protein [Methanospirillum sp.]|nr:DUF2637 domain-containing protein [Methanospirillum sp.]
MNHTRLIQYILAFFFCIIASSSFILSYVNLTAAAIQAGIPDSLAWMWPLCIDSFISMGAVFILQSNLNREPSWQGWGVLISFTVASGAFNIVHSPPDFWSQVAHVIPPVAQCVSLELLMIRIKRDLMTSPELTVGSEITPDLPAAISQEKIEKVREWFTVNPNGTINQARIALSMGPATVKNCRAYLIKNHQLTDLTE